MTVQSTGAAFDDTQVLLQTLDGLQDLIESEAGHNEDATQVSDSVISALEQSGVFGLMAPRAVGGLEGHPLQIFEALRKLAYFDGSTGWYCQAAITGPAVSGAFLGDSAVEAIFHSGVPATCAGQAAPTGKAEREGDCYRISGKFSFGSGIPNARWVVGGYVLHENGAPIIGGHGLPAMLIAFAPRDRVRLTGNWDVLGLRGTGSYDFEVEEQRIHADFAFEAGVAQAQRGGALYRMGFNALPSLCHAAWAIGCTERMLEEWIAHAHAKKRNTGRTIAEHDSFQKDLAWSKARLQSASIYVRDTFTRLYDGALAGTNPDSLKVDGRLCATLALITGNEICQTAFTSSATTGLRNGSRLQRCFRDMQAGNAHFLTGEQSLIETGAFLAGQPGSSHGLL